MATYPPIADRLTKRAIERAAADAGELPARASSEARRLVLLVELEQLSTADLVDLSGFLNGLLGNASHDALLTTGMHECAGDCPPLERAVSVRAAYAFGDWPPSRLEAVRP